ncbi:DUF3046 domain-containing protein [Gleimia hominis]|uniref:DUF3046 domain-containing protein n=1 Tax=Gleimia hominis TaxID=595468 RepID=A0ABU3IAW2_9ACTO|nr:DUF3046 domain-containing protein [Gleimia hominis]MDT3767519.1 DUF3046 domain-containing protein [Gleimia hominis]WIK64935.1 DUF3046 domain-containing protein [Gleimia hominis]
MTISEFWRNVEAVYGSCYGRSLVGDLFLPHLGGTAEQALKDGMEPDTVWNELVDETDVGDEARWVHRQPQPAR